MKKRLVVKKFGGTSVGTLERVRNVALLIKQFLEKNPDTRVAVVVSAMAGETNRLVDLAKTCVTDPAPREMDVLLATGELVSIALLSMSLIDIGLPAESFDAQQAQISTDAKYGSAQIQNISGERLKQIVDRGVIPVVAGFQGVDEEGNVTTLGRGGSDITAVALAAALNADECYIYTDVEGVYSTDPRICDNARALKYVCHEEMLEMASLGAKVLHPRSVYFAMRYRVPLVVMSTFNPGHGTWIVEEEKLMEKPIVTGVTYRTDETKVTMRSIPGEIKSIDRIFSCLGDSGIFIDMITQTGLVDGKTNISFTIPNESAGKAQEIVAQLVRELGAESAKFDKDIAKVSVVGIGMRYHTGVAAKMFRALAAEGIEVQMISTSEIKISVVVPKKYSEVAVRSLHDAFLEEKPEISVET